MEFMQTQKQNQEEKPKKQRRRRRTKAEMEKVRAAEEKAKKLEREARIAAGLPPEPPKKKRGRPSKKQLQEEAAQDALVKKQLNEDPQKASLFEQAKKAATRDEDLVAQSSINDALSRNLIGGLGSGLPYGGADTIFAQDKKSEEDQAQTRRMQEEKVARNFSRQGLQGMHALRGSQTDLIGGTSLGATSSSSNNDLIGGTLLGGATSNNATSNNAASNATASNGAAKPLSSSSEDQSSNEDSDHQNAHRRNKRGRHGNNNRQRKEIVPSATRDELANLADDELVGRALLLHVDPTEYGERDDLVSAVYNALLKSEGFVEVEGILDILPDGYGFIRTEGYLPSEHDVYVASNMIRRNGLRKGDNIAGRVRPPREGEKYPALNTILALNKIEFNGPQHRVKFNHLTPVYPDERLVLEHGKDAITARAIDLVSPIGKGQRGLIVSPPKAGKTTVLKDIAAAISANNPEVHLMCLLVDERPEEVTDMQRSINGEVVSSTFDMPADNHIAVAELVIERAKRLVETGYDVVILLDSITRLARAYNLAQPASGRILSGGVDSTALYPPKRFLGAARNIENGGSLTILGTALIDTGSKMDEVIFEEFKGTGNMELKLDRGLAERRIFPAIDPVASSTRKDELLVDAQTAPLVWGLRRLLANMNNTERAMNMLVKSLRQTKTNQEFLIKSARKSNKQNTVS